MDRVSKKVSRSEYGYVYQTVHPLRLLTAVAFSCIKFSPKRTPQLFETLHAE